MNQRKLDRILDAYQDGDIDRTDFKGRYQSLKERLTSLENTRERLIEQASREQISFANMQASFEEILRFGHNRENLSEEGKTKRLQAVVKEIGVTRNHADVDLLVEGRELSHLDYPN